MRDERVLKALRTAAAREPIRSALHDGTHPDAAAHEQLGLATKAEIAALPALVQQPAIANVNRTGLATEQITKLQDKVDEILAALRGAGVIQS